MMILKLAATAVLSVFLMDQAVQPQKEDAPKKEDVAKEAAIKETVKRETATKETEAQKKDASKTEAAKKSDADLHEIEKQIIEQTNAQRARYGLPPLVVDRNLVQSARTHTAWMTNNRSLQHTSKPVAENIAMGQRTTGEAIGSWMNSAGHRANILNGGHKRIGVAAYRTPDGTIFWCQQFAP